MSKKPKINYFNIHFTEDDKYTIIRWNSLLRGGYKLLKLKVGRRTSSRQASCLLLPLLSLLDRQILIYWFIYKFFYLFNQNRPILWWCNWCKHYRNQRYLLFGSINKSNVMLQLPFSSLLICYMFYMHFLCYQQSILFLLIVQTVWFHLGLPRIFWDRII